jgi:hypothetical protein
LDTETLKTIFPLLGGALTLVGGLFTFVSGRLKDAKGRDARDRVVTLTLQWLSFAFGLSALLVIFLSPGYAVPVFLFFCQFVTQIVLFLRKSEPMQRIDVVVLSLICSFYAFFFASALVFYYTGIVLGLLGNTH